jgi:hypothetical protein
MVLLGKVPYEHTITAGAAGSTTRIGSLGSSSFHQLNPFLVIRIVRWKLYRTKAQAAIIHKSVQHIKDHYQEGRCVPQELSFAIAMIGDYSYGS